MLSSLFNERSFLLIFLSVLCLHTIEAKHIISGSIDYTCLGNDEYSFQLNLERDCFAGGAQFDQVISVSIFTENGLYQNVQVPIGNTEENIFLPNGDCDPSTSEFCVQSTSYSFTTFLVNDGSTYQISYQRCCWAFDIINLLDPGENGLTITTEIGPESLDLCNSSPMSNVPLSFAACPGESISVDLPFEDADGDSLSYELCLPLAGGGIKGTNELPGDPTDCDGLYPEDCPPPYSTLTFAEGFSFDNPFPTENGFEIDNELGIFSFTTSEQGRFIYSFCISEYRDGILIGLHRKIIFINNSASFIISGTEEWNHTSLDIQHIQNNIFISNNEEIPYRISLYNMEGALQIKSESFRVDNQISTLGLEGGIYIVEARAKNGYSISKKVLIL